MKPALSNKTNPGFTLIEISIALIIIGLVVGGVLVGQDLISAATIRAQVSQIEKYNAAVHTFQNKYGYLPGDIPDPYASNFGFLARGTYPGQGDGNGIIQGNYNNSASAHGYDIGGASNETNLFWKDLKTAQLMGGLTWVGNPSLTPAKLGGQNSYVYAYSDATDVNYWGVSAIKGVGAYVVGEQYPGITVQQAYNIDSKIDDGLPLSGNVNVCYLNLSVSVYTSYAAGNTLKGANAGLIFYNDGTYCTPTTNATPYLNTNCYDNAYAGGAAANQQYQLQNTNIQNCALSFKMQ